MNLSYITFRNSPIPTKLGNRGSYHKCSFHYIKYSKLLRNTNLEIQKILQL